MARIPFLSHLQSILPPPLHLIFYILVISLFLLNYHSLTVRPFIPLPWLIVVLLIPAFQTRSPLATLSLVARKKFLYQ